MSILNLPDVIQSLYKPTQPAIKESVEGVHYVEALPDPHLRSAIYCYWELKTAAPLNEPFFYRVVADGCIDIFFEPGNVKENFVMGFCSQYTAFPLANSFHYVGIRFLPTMFSQLFKLDASELTNRFEETRHVIPHTALFISESMSPADSFTEIRKKLDLYFLAHVLNSSFQPDSRLYDAIEMILINQGMVNMETVAKIGISPRQLRRLFNFYVGDTPKVFSQIVRFQNILHAKPSSESLRKNKLFFDAGYFDQSHFIKEFKTLYGLTPTQAFEK